MPQHHTEAEPSNLNLSSILVAVFKRKRTILFSTAAGAIAAAAVYLLWPHSYESDAALLVRYVLDRSAGVMLVDLHIGAPANTALTRSISTDGI